MTSKYYLELQTIVFKKLKREEVREDVIRDRKCISVCKNLTEQLKVSLWTILKLTLRQLKYHFDLY